jgi:quercetin dioxygenase-like cupin family protein
MKPEEQGSTAPEEVTSSLTRPASATDGEGEASFSVFDLARPREFRCEGPAVQLLAESRAFRLLLLSLRSGQQLRTHRTRSRALIQVLEGRVVCVLPRSRVNMGAGTLLQLAPQVAHSVEALSDAVLLVTLVREGGEGATADERQDGEPEQAGADLPEDGEA